MAEQHGGYRKPSNPAPVSAPGAMSRRTDGGPAQTTVPMTGMGYGENADYNDIQSSAPLAAAPSVPTARTRNTRPTGSGAAAATPLFAPTGRPDEPVTAGAPFGPGAGPALTAPAAASSQDLELVRSYLPDLELAMNFKNVPDSYKALVSYLKAM